MTTSFIVIALFWNLLAPAPPQIAINPETKECGYYWGGDEYAWNYLSPPWELINDNTPIQTEKGIYKWDGDFSNIESFCNQIGYTYVAGNLGEIRGKHRLTTYAYILLAIKFAPLIIVTIILLIALVIFLRRANKKDNNASAS